MPSKRKAPTPAEDHATANPDAPADQPPQPDKTPDPTPPTTATAATGDNDVDQAPNCLPGEHDYKKLVKLDGSPASTMHNERCVNCGAKRRVT